MKSEYDFTNATRGKFYKKNAEYHTPVYLDPKLEVYFIKLAQVKKLSLNEVVNSVLSKDIEIAELVSFK
jgi:hypothetical protein